MTRTVNAEAVLTDDCSAVTITLHEVLIGNLADTLTTLGHPDMIRQWVEGVNAQIPIKRAGLGETRRILSVDTPE